MHLLSTAAHTGGVNSDLAFKGTLAFAGHYGGFRVIDLAEPGAPVELAGRRPLQRTAGRRHRPRRPALPVRRHPAEHRGL
jgi:hypothetical protein